jgi:hypothetical protein
VAFYNKGIKVEFSDENFDLYFIDQMKRLTPEQKDKIPNSIRSFIFRFGGDKLSVVNASKLSVSAKLFCIWIATGKRVKLVVEADDLELPNAKQSKETGKTISIEEAEVLRDNGSFVLGEMSLVNSYSHINLVSSSSAYNYLVQVKNATKTKAEKQKIATEYVVKTLLSYDQKKSRILYLNGLNEQEYYVLLFLYNGLALSSGKIYQSHFANSKLGSAAYFKRAFVSLQQKGLIEKIGDRKGALVKITTLGTLRVNEIVSKLIDN